MKDLKKDSTKVIKISESVNIMLDINRDTVMHARIVIGLDGTVVL
jgi:hypothetical protein